MGRRNHYRDTSFTRSASSAGAEARKAEAALREIGESVLAAAKDALSKGAEMLVRDAKSRCPVYEGHKKSGKRYIAHGVVPGALRESIAATPNKERTIYRISADAKSPDNFLYGQIVEFSPRVNRPFLYPALEANRAAVENCIAEAIRRAVDKGG